MVAEVARNALPLSQVCDGFFCVLFVAFIFLLGGQGVLSLLPKNTPNTNSSHSLLFPPNNDATPHTKTTPSQTKTKKDAFGNYVVQYVLELGQSEASAAVVAALGGHYAELSMQKFSSNVVEKVLKLGGLDAARAGVIREMLTSPLLPRLLQDSYGNYVVQSALSVSSGQLHSELVDAIRPYLPALRGTPHGKRILQKVATSAVGGVKPPL